MIKQKETDFYSNDGDDAAQHGRELAAIINRIEKKERESLSNEIDDDIRKSAIRCAEQKEIDEITIKERDFLNNQKENVI